MSTQTIEVTADAFFHYPSDGNRRELVKGEVHTVSPAGGNHGGITIRLTLSLGNHVISHGLGTLFAAETGFKLFSNPDTVRAPDISFVAAPRAEEAFRQKRFIPFAPDLVVEVASPGDRATEVMNKIADWLQAGTQVVIIIDPDRETAAVHRAQSNAVILSKSDILSAEDVVPGWSIRIADLF